MTGEDQTVSSEQEAQIARRSKSSKWFRNLPDAKISSYARKFVAILDCEVIAVASTREDILEMTSSYDQPSIVIEYVRVAFCPYFVVRRGK